MRDEYKNILITIIVFSCARYYFVAYSVKRNFLNKYFRKRNMKRTHIYIYHRLTVHPQQLAPRLREG